MVKYTSNDCRECFYISDKEFLNDSSRQNPVSSKTITRTVASLMSLNFINAGKKRGLPMNWKSLKSFTASYSQMGEDIYLSYLFGPTKNTGKYLDIGSYDPIQYSNTYLLYQRGWTGIAIEPNHSFKKEWRKYRPKDLFINIGISNHEQDLYLAEHKTYPAMNKLCNANEKEDLQRNNEKFSNQET